MIQWFRSNQPARIGALMFAMSGLLIDSLPGHFAGAQSAADTANIKAGTLPSGTPTARALAAHKKRVISICYAPDGKTLASASEDTMICLWNAETGELLRTLTSTGGDVQTLAFYPDSVTLLSGDREGFASFWDTRTGRIKRRTMVSARAIKSIVLSPGAEYAVVVTSDESLVDDHVYLWDGALKGRLYGIEASPPASTGIAFSPDGKLLALGSDHSTDYTARVWQVQTGKQLMDIRNINNGNGRLAMSPDGNLMAINWSSALLIIEMKDLMANRHGFYDVAPPEHHRSVLPVRYVQALTFSPDGKSLATSDCTGKKTQVRIWDMETGALKTRWACEDSVNVLTYSPDGRTLAAACGKTVKLWPVEAASTASQATK